MRTLLWFIGLWLISLFVAYLVALSFADVFRAQEEFIAVQFLIVGYSLIATAIFGAVYAFARTTRPFAIAAALLVVVAVAGALVPTAYDAFHARSTDPWRGDLQKSAELLLELLAPIFVMVGVQWRWVRRRWLMKNGGKQPVRWPWWTTAAAVAVAVSPIGIAVTKSAIEYNATDFLRDLWVMTMAIAAAVAVVLGVAEFYIRARRIRAQSVTTPSGS